MAAAGSPGRLAKELQQLVRQAGDSALADIELSVSQYAVLHALAHTPGASAAERRMDGVEEQLVSGLTTTDRNTLVRLMERCAANLR